VQFIVKFCKVLSNSKDMEKGKVLAIVGLPDSMTPIFSPLSDRKDVNK